MGFQYDLLFKLKDINLPVLINNSSKTGKTLEDSLENYFDIINGYRNEIDGELFSSIENMIKMIIKTHRSFINGHFLEAYQSVDKILSKNQHNINITTLRKEYFYRSRTADSKSNFLKEDMFHIPLKERFKVGSQRFSAPGIPCLYLGSSSYVCWLEAGRPAENTFYISALYSLDNLQVLDLTLTPLNLLNHSYDSSVIDDNSAPWFIERIETNNNMLKKFLLTFPISIACGIKILNVEERSRAFKEEYIIPQLILQSLTQNGIHGVAYLSTYLGKNYDTSVLKNYAFPVNPENEQLLEAKFAVSCPITLAEARNITNSNIQSMLDAVRDYILGGINHEDNLRVLHSNKLNETVNPTITTAEKILFGYNSTDFYTIDRELIKCNFL